MRHKSAAGKFAVAVSTALLVGCCLAARAQSDTSLEQRIQRIMSRLEFAHSRFGVKIINANTGEVVYQRNATELFVPGSTTKLVTEGTALELLGPAYRFHTKIYRTGPIEQDGTLEGDVVLVASGDLNLSNRIQSDGTLAFENEDHSYGGPDSHGLAGDPMVVMQEFAEQIAAKGIKRISGEVLVDASLFPEGYRELGTGVVVSPMVVNDNVIDVVVSPGASEHAPAKIRIAPQTSYVTISNQVSTGKAGTRADLKYEQDKVNADGTHAVVLAGSVALSSKPVMAAYVVPEPSRFAATVLLEALKEKGVTARLPGPAEATNFKTLAQNYTAGNLVAEHVSPPWKEEVKVTLKVSQNLHASAVPFLLGALLGHKESQVDQEGFDIENVFLTKAGLDLGGAAQSDGAGGDAFFTPEFMVQYLAYMSKQKNFEDFYGALPILGKDGTLAKIQVNSPAAGHVHAKTGTYGTYDALNRKVMISGKGLAGYMDTAGGQHLIFALYVNMVSVSADDPEAAQKVAGEALGQIATEAYGDKAEK